MPMPRDACLNDPVLLVILVAANLLIFIAYMTIPAVMGWVALHSRRLPFPAIWVLFGSFIVACGFTHLVGALVFFRPAWHLEAAVCFLTAVVSMATATLLWRLRHVLLRALCDYETFEAEMQKLADERRG